MKTAIKKHGLYHTFRMALVVGMIVSLTSNVSNGSEKVPRFNKIPTKSLHKKSKVAFGKETKSTNSGYPYPLATCVVSGAAMGTMGEAVVYVYQGREIRFCCSDCENTFLKSPDEYLQKIDQAIIQQQLPIYPVDTCPVTDNKLGEMGDPVNLVYKNRLVRLCCNGCVQELEKLPARYLEKLDKAMIAKQKTAYSFDACVVTGRKLGSMGQTIDFLVGNQLVRLCCNACVATIQKDPAKYMALIAPVGEKTESMPYTPHQKMGHDAHSTHHH
ncbi:MAG: hypothetical protein C4527_26805 [Candidatus Omnitrophota bacterium]|nr:MAG: hypothetical protein C4527_26805 [Candidatus Omnitrophota bacterium]